MSIDLSIDWLKINQMDWYISRESDDLIVPNDSETSDLLCDDDTSLSSNDWLQWGVTAPENFKSPNKRHSAAAMELTTEEFNLGKSDTSRHGHGFLDCLPDYQLQNIKGSGCIERMDEIFLNSLFAEDSPDMENPYRPVGIFIESECSSMTAENLMTDMLIDSQSIVKNSSSMGSSKHLKTNGFPIAMGGMSDDWDKKGDGPPLQFTPSDSGSREGSPTVKAPVSTVSIPSELNSSYEADAHLEEESLDAAVLQELKDTMSQLNQKTRICCRDALYRLAISSKQNHSADQCNTEFIVEEPSTASDKNERSRYSSTKSESETNVIDRTIMNLLFHELNCGLQNFHV